MTRRLWATLGGTLFEEFPLVRSGPAVGGRRLDGLILVDEPSRLAASRETFELPGRDVVVIQTKANRLGMNVLGQALFSAELLRQAGVASVRTIALCTANDEVLQPLAARYGIEVVVDEGEGPRWVRSLGDASH
jgi:hypothetical protein